MKPSLFIVGLGNPGKEYARTRHNAGFQAMDVLAETYGQGLWKRSEKFDAELQEATVVTVPILLVKPHTYMNLSRQSIRALVDFYKLDPKTQLIVVCDDIDLPLGILRLRQKGSAGTHNGLKSIVETFGEDFPRLRIGIGPKPERVDLAAWVLSVMTEEEQKALRSAYEKIPAIVKGFVIEKEIETA